MTPAIMGSLRIQASTGAVAALATDGPLTLALREELRAALVIDDRHLDVLLSNPLARSAIARSAQASAAPGAPRNATQPAHTPYLLDVVAPHLQGNAMTHDIAETERHELQLVLGYSSTQLDQLLGNPTSRADLTRQVRSQAFRSAVASITGQAAPPRELTAEQRAACKALGLPEQEYVETLWAEEAQRRGYSAASQLSAAERAACEATGVSPADFIAARDRH